MKLEDRLRDHLHAKASTFEVPEHRFVDTKIVPFHSRRRQYPALAAAAALLVVLVGVLALLTDWYDPPAVDEASVVPTLPDRSTPTTSPSISPTFAAAPVTLFLPASVTYDGSEAWLFSAAEPGAGVEGGWGLAAASTTDGTTWEGHGTVIESAARFDHVAYAHGRFTTIGRTPTGATAYTSVDGVTWSPLDVPAGTEPVHVLGAPEGSLVLVTIEQDPLVAAALAALPEAERALVESGVAEFSVRDLATGQVADLSIGHVVVARHHLEDLGVAGSPRPGPMFDVWTTANGSDWEASGLTGAALSGRIPIRLVATDDGSAVINANETVDLFDGSAWSQADTPADALMTSPPLQPGQVLLDVAEGPAGTVSVVSGPVETVEPSTEVRVGDVRVLIEAEAIRITGPEVSAQISSVGPFLASQAIRLGPGGVELGPLAEPDVVVPVEDLVAALRLYDAIGHRPLRALFTSEGERWQRIEMTFSVGSSTHAVAVADDYVVILANSPDRVRTTAQVASLGD